MKKTTWSHLCMGNVAHIVKDSSIKDELGRKVGVTFCGKETNTNIDEWNEEKHIHQVCGVCYRAREKKRGMRISRHERLYRLKVIDLDQI